MKKIWWVIINRKKKENKSRDASKIGPKWIKNGQKLRFTDFFTTGCNWNIYHAQFVSENMKYLYYLNREPDNWPIFLEPFNKIIKTI